MSENQCRENLSATMTSNISVSSLDTGSHSWHASETKKLVRPVYRHFARKSYNFHRDQRIVPLEQCEPDALPEREAYWIRTLQTLIPHDLNSAYGKF